MLRDHQAITFRAVHRQSGLSLDFLYSNDTVIRVLTSQLQAAKREHRHEVDQLRNQLAVATGEILVLREQVRILETRAAGQPGGT